jgi:hypothetical protein
MANATATQTPAPTTEKAAPVNQTEVLLKILKSDDFLGKVVVSLKNTGLFRENVEQSAKDYVDTAIYAVQSPDNLALGDIRFKWKPEQTAKAILGLASKGLPYNPMQGLGYLVGYKIKDQPGQINVTPIPGVRGMERLIQRTGRVGAMKFTAVRASDVFECNEYGKEPPKHIRKHTMPNVPNPILYGCASIYVRSIEGYHNVSVPVDEAALASVAGLMTPEQRAGYLAYRKCIREVTNTYLHDVTVVADAVAAEAEEEDRKALYAATQPAPVISAPPAEVIVANAAPVVPEPVVSTAPQFAPPSAPVVVVDDLDDNDPAMQAIAASKESVAASTPIKTLVPVAVTAPVQRPITPARPPRLV